MRIALAQINTTVGDFDGNLARVRGGLEEARREGVDLVVFPEQTLPGYPAEDLLERPSFWRDTGAAFDRVVELSRGHPSGVVIGTLTPTGLEAGKPVYNTAALIADGEVLLEQHKTLLPTYDVFDEARYFQPADRHAVVEFRGRRLGLAICEDVWNDPAFWPHRLYPVDPVERFVRGGADLLVVISASPFSLGRPRFRVEMLKELVEGRGVDLVYVNLVGGNTTLLFDGNSLALSRQGETLARSASCREDFTVVDLSRPDEMPAAGSTESTEVGDDRAEVADIPTGITDIPTDAATDDDVAEAYAALVLGTRDYLEKTGFSRAVIGLSGGIDSSLTAAIAVDALGAENVIGVAMPSRYSSPGSVTDATTLAGRLGIRFYQLPIEAMFQAALETLEPVFEGLEPDVTEENLQARVRGQLLMAISNKLGALLLTTGNKSELAVGYCTLYGDMCGGLAVISDVPKTLVYRMSRHVNRAREVIPQSVLEKPPSAELRPDQLDEDSLPPYEALDAILEAYIEDGADPDAIVESGHDRALVLEVLSLVDRNEYKRKQAAPGLRITSKAFGPGRRFPIVQKYRPGRGSSR